ncbi:1-phosphofructokinase family hexose kinase [Nakamurella lactea]|uniref:1-phosphofructokinase family hexose kinase n=1 Tax=Nakamurella lactea TaxID=459515 RepID=UPI00041F7BEA|nr:PfkB family carbohydrate kinase [Nakamurella lactea]
MLVVTPNLTFDVTVRLPALIPGAVVRASETVTTGGGKGVNVVRASTARGLRGTRLLGFLPADDGDRLATVLAGESVELVGVPATGAVRVCTIFLEDDGRTTVVNGRGPQITGEQWDAFLAAVTNELRAGEVLVCSGSLPPGVPVDGYGRLVELAHAKGSPAVVDAAPAALEAALPYRPDLVCPNLSEAEGLLHGRVDEQVHESGDDLPERAAAAAAALHERGAVRAVVTAGAAGAALATADGRWWLTAPPVEVVSPIGAGDSFVGGAAPALAAGRADLDIVIDGMATASASVEQLLAGGVDPARVPAIAALITVQRLSSERPDNTPDRQSDPIPASRR